MESKGRLPPYVRRPLPGPSMVHHDPFGPGLLPAPGPFPPFDMLPHPGILEQKLAAQHVEIEKLATENQRLADTHGICRQELAAAHHELQMLHSHIGAVKSEREHQMRGLMDRVGKMENELKGVEPLRSELQKARVDAEKLVAQRQELLSKVHKLNQDLHRAHTDVQQIPVLMSELEGLRQEYQRCRVSYDYEKKLFSDHLESLQAMEKDYHTMAREVEKLRSELNNTAAGGLHGSATGNIENEASARPIGQNIYEDGYPKGQGHTVVTGNASVGANTGAGGGTPTYAGTQSGSAPNAPRVPGYEPIRIAGYDPQRVPGYDPSRVPSYDPQRIPGYDPSRVPSYDLQRPPGSDVYRGAASRGTAALANNTPYGSATQPTRPVGGYEVPPRR